MDRKALNLPILISLVVGNMIGTGIYVLPASLAEYGTISLFSWVYTSVGAVFLALTFASLNRRYPKTGGPYVYCKQAYGKLAGFIVAYTYWTSNMVSIAGIAVASTGYLGFITPVLDANGPAYNHMTALACELGIVWLFTFINIIGIHTAGIVQLFLTLIKVTPLILVILVGMGSVHLENLTQFTVSHESTFTALSSAAALTFWAFIGLESATVPAENTRGYRDISRATIYGTLATAAIYILSSFVLMGMIPASELKNSQFPFAEAGTMLFGPYSAVLIAICAFISGLGALNVCTLIQGQIVFAAARDHLFPRLFAKLSKRDVPVAGQLLSSTLVTLFLILTIEPTLLKQFNNIALLAALLTLLTYFATTLSELKFIIQSGQSFLRVLFTKSMLIALLAAAYSGWMISSFDAQIVGIALLIILFCIPVYYFIIRKYASA
ncbi:Arginine/agmatine antiporter [Aquicella siphonis]|uniref:Arginine/agmatine antiporter n=1 Tax=Aquicella siphonis TaxID=254247 RepID=A0A5E4PLS4_9COXI|nr:amino acid permease [Aquicella siphonis]VVC77253.1 Arginine/agmatine antiporter [Aquicella siphonis]